MNRFSMLALLFFLIPGVAHAHDFWFERQGDKFVLQNGHHGGKVFNIDASKVKSIRCMHRGSAPRDMLKGAVSSPTNVKVFASCDIISGFHYGGFWSKTPDGDKNLPKNQVPDAVKAWESKQYAKWVDRNSPTATTPIGDELEIVPVSDLSHAKQGDKITIRVLFHGKPISGAVGDIDDKALGESDSAGELRLGILSRSVETIAVTLRRPISTPEADQQVLEATLSYDVGK